MSRLPYGVPLVAILAGFSFGTIVPTAAEPLPAPDTAATSPAAPPSDADVDAEELNWNAFDWHAINVVEAPARARTFAAPKAATLTPATFANRRDNKDGSAALTVGRHLPTSWDSKIGVDLGVAPQPAMTYQPDRPHGVTSNSSAGAAWASVNVPAPATPIGWDKALIEARVDPLRDEGKVGATLARSLPITREFVLTLQNSYTLTEALPSMATSQAATVGNSATLATGTVMSSWATEPLVRFNILPSGTSFSAGAKLSSTNDKWLRSLSAEQKLFGGPLSITGTASEMATGAAVKSITAGFKHSW